MRYKQPALTIGKVTTGGIGVQDVQVGGVSTSWKNISSNVKKQAGENVLVIFADDDTPVIIGDAGYRVSE